MKKLLFLLVIVVGCTQDYDKIKPKAVEGVRLEIDSTKWTPALVQIKGDKVSIYESREIREVTVPNPPMTWLLGFVTGALVCLLIVLLTNENK
jgi:hypothetical protein